MAHAATNGTHTVTRALDALANGDPDAADAILARLYEELRALARRELAGDPMRKVLAPTDLAHRAFLKAIQERARDWGNRGMFLASVVRIMRRVIVDAARALAAEKRGGGGVRIDLPAAEPLCHGDPARVVALDEILDQLEGHDAEVAAVVEMRVFADMTHEEIKEALAVSLRTVERRWRYARAWLRRALADPEGPPADGERLRGS